MLRKSRFICELGWEKTLRNNTLHSLALENCQYSNQHKFRKLITGELSF